MYCLLVANIDNDPTGQGARHVGYACGLVAAYPGYAHTDLGMRTVHAPMPRPADQEAPDENAQHLTHSAADQEERAGVWLGAAAAREAGPCLCMKRAGLSPC
jgi:hypothetical protein